MSESSARARRESGRPPVSLSACRSTARSNGIPFQCVIVTPATKCASRTDRRSTFDTTYFGRRAGPKDSTRNGRLATGSATVHGPWYCVCASRRRLMSSVSFAVKLEVGHRRRLLAQMLEPAQHVDAVERSLQWPVDVDAIEDTASASRTSRRSPQDRGITSTGVSA